MRDDHSSVRVVFIKLLLHTQTLFTLKCLTINSLLASWSHQCKHSGIFWSNVTEVDDGCYCRCRWGWERRQQGTCWSWGWWLVLYHYPSWCHPTLLQNKHTDDICCPTHPHHPHCICVNKGKLMRVNWALLVLSSECTD